MWRTCWPLSKLVAGSLITTSPFSVKPMHTVKCPLPVSTRPGLSEPQRGGDDHRNARYDPIFQLGNIAESSHVCAHAFETACEAGVERPIAGAVEAVVKKSGPPPRAHRCSVPAVARHRSNAPKPWKEKSDCTPLLCRIGMLGALRRGDDFAPSRAIGGNFSTGARLSRKLRPRNFIGAGLWRRSMSTDIARPAPARVALKVSIFTLPSASRWPRTLWRA